MRPKSLIDANYDRAIFIANLIANRIPGEHAWAGFDSSKEDLSRKLVTNDLLVYSRRNTNTFADIFFRVPKITEPKKIEWGEENVVESNIIEQHTDTYHKKAGIEYNEDITHTFSEITTMEKAFEFAAEQSIRAYFEASYEGIKGGVELQAKLNEKYSEKWGTQTTHTDTISKHLDLPVDFEGDLHYKAVRSTDHVQRRVVTTCNFEYEVGFVSGPVIPPDNKPLILHDWASLEEFISVATGYASSEKPMYDIFIQYPINQYEENVIRESGEQTVEMLLDYRNVNHQDIELL